MRNDVQKPQGGGVPRNHRNGSSNEVLSVRSLSNCMRIVSSAASNVASTVRKAGVSIVSSIANGHDDADHDQVLWAGFDKLEMEGDVHRQVLLLGYGSGFQVWDVEQADDVRQLACRHDFPASFLQMQKKPIALKGLVDRFADVRPVLIVVGDGYVNGNFNNFDGFGFSSNGSVGGCQEMESDNSLPTYAHFYSLRTHEYEHVLKFNSAILSVRCSPRVIAVCQTSQIQCLNAATLERENIIVTNPVASASVVSGSIGYGPLAVGTRWLAYSGIPVPVSSNCPVTAQDVSPATVTPSRGSLMAHFARESSKTLAAGLVTLGDKGLTTFSKYYTEFVGDNNGFTVHGNSNSNSNKIMHREPANMENDEMVIVEDIVSRSVIVQFRAHKSPISALCFDPSGTLLVTASIHGRNINVFRIMPSPHSKPEGSGAKGTCVHLFKLQRGITNAVIQDISFSDDSKWIVISSSRGTSHLFAICPSGGAADLKFNERNIANICYGSALTTKMSVHLSQNSCSSKISEQSLYGSGSPVTLSAVCRIKNGKPGFKSTVNGLAAAGTGKISPSPGAIASVFHYCKGTGLNANISSLRKMYYFLVFFSSGSIIQYVLHQSSREYCGTDQSGLSSIAHELSHEAYSRSDVEALQKWDVCHKRNRKDGCDNVDIYGDHGSGENTKFLCKDTRKEISVYNSASGVDLKTKLAAKQTPHLYISEFELHVHEAWVPLWSKSKISFNVLMDQNSKEAYSGNSVGEIEIERIPCRTIEAKLKDLVPVFDHLQSPTFQQPRTDDSDLIPHGPPTCLKTGLSEVGEHSHRSSCSSLDSVPENAVIAELPNSNSNGGWTRSSQDTDKGFLSNHTDCPNMESNLESVNNNEGLKTEASLEFVNNTEPEAGDTPRGHR
ncbi:unnamed protein product [Musa acuminata subsp. burmannicoides]